MSTTTEPDDRGLRTGSARSRMFYQSIKDLPLHCHLHLPEPALKVYRDAFNRAWARTVGSQSRHRDAQMHALAEVRRKFEKEPLTGRWVPKGNPSTR